MNTQFGWKNSVIKRLENRKGRKVIIYGSDKFTMEIRRTLIKLNIPIFYMVDDTSVNNDRLFEVKSYECLKHEESKEVFVLVAKLVGHHVAYENLKKYGFKYNIDFSIMNIGGYIEPIDCIDSLLTYNRSKDEYLGFKVFGKNSGYKIVTLGNSTSDIQTGGETSWSEHLYNIFKEKGYDIQLICGAMTGYTSTQEFLKLCRDVLLLEPNLVIDMSGYNDIAGNAYVPEYPYLHKYQNKFYEFLKQNKVLAPDSMDIRNIKDVVHGMKNSKSDFEIWVENMRKMHAICTEFGIHFMGYLQPMVEYGGYQKNKVLGEIIEEYITITGNNRIGQAEAEFCENAKILIQDYDYIIDITDIFNNYQEVYFDTCHCNSKGNKIIANRIYQDLMDLIKKKI